MERKGPQVEIINWESDDLGYSEDGVDLALIRWMLSLTPAERLAAHQRRIDAILELRGLNADHERLPNQEE